MVLPVGTASQELLVVEKTKQGVRKKSVLPVRFVPMTGEALSLYRMLIHLGYAELDSAAVFNLYERKSR